MVRVGEAQPMSPLDVVPGFLGPRQFRLHPYCVHALLYEPPSGFNATIEEVRAPKSNITQSQC